MTAATWTRRDHLAALGAGHVFDLVVIGGGIVGAGIALDAAARGLRVAVLERTDFGAGTSGRSTKLLHGGIRYLPQGRLGLVREGLREQRILRHTADYLFDPIEFVLPMYAGRRFGDVPRLFGHPWLAPLGFRVGLALYDRLGRRPPEMRARPLSAAEVVERAPLLTTEGLRGGFAYHDARTDDSRLTLAVLQTAVTGFGAVVVNWLEATGVTRSGAGFAVRGHDRLGDATVTVAGRTVVAATGPFSPPGLDGAPPPLDLIESKGIHLNTTLEAVGIGDRALVLPETEDGRILFVVPWQGTAMVGTTDTPYSGDPGRPVPDDADVAYLLRHLEDYLGVTNIPILSVWAGIRALAAKPGAATAGASRSHTFRDVAPGYVQVAGGKLTGYRPIAADVVDRVAGHLERRVRSTTATLPLSGAGFDPDPIRARAAGLGLSTAYGELLYRRMGGHAHRVLDLAAGDPRLAATLGPDHLTGAEVVHAVRHEAAATVSDIVLRRTHLAWVEPGHGRAAAPAILDLMAGELGWTGAERETRRAAFEAELAAEAL